jgi:hypothetical protein
MALSSQAKAKGEHRASVQSDQMVLGIVRREAGPVAWWPKTPNESWKTTLGSQGTLPKTGKKEPAYSFLWEDEEGRC